MTALWPSGRTMSGHCHFRSEPDRIRRIKLDKILHSGVRSRLRFEAEIDNSSAGHLGIAHCDGVAGTAQSDDR